MDAGRSVLPVIPPLTILLVVQRIAQPTIVAKCVVATRALREAQVTIPDNNASVICVGFE